MNDDIIVVNSYPNTIEREVILKKCIIQLKKTKKEILLISHYPIKREIQQLVDYFIYDMRNYILDKNMLYWYRNENFYFQTGTFELGGAAYAILLSIQNAFFLAKSLKKKMLYYFEYDYIIADEDLKNIDFIKNEIYKNDKRGYVRIKSHGGDRKQDGICTTFFALDVDFFFENFSILKTEKKYIESSPGGVALEFYFYKALSEKFSYLEVDYNDSRFTKEFFPNSSFNLSSYEIDHFIDILPEKTSRKPILTITNPKKNLREYKIKFLKNDNDVNEAIVSVPSNGHYYNVLNKKIKSVKVFYKENDNWNLVYDKFPELEVANKKDCEYARITHE